MTTRKKIAKEQNPLPKQPKEYFIPATYDSPARSCMPTVKGPFEIKHSIIQMLPSFYGLEYENPFTHIDAFLEICSLMFLNNISCLRIFAFSLKERLGRILRPTSPLRN